MQKRPDAGIDGAPIKLTGPLIKNPLQISQRLSGTVHRPNTEISSMNKDRRVPSKRNSILMTVPIRFLPGMAKDNPRPHWQYHISSERWE